MLFNDYHFLPVILLIGVFKIFYERNLFSIFKIETSNLAGIKTLLIGKKVYGNFHMGRVGYSCFKQSKFRKLRAV